MSLQDQLLPTTSPDLALGSLRVRRAKAILSRYQYVMIGDVLGALVDPRDSYDGISTGLHQKSIYALLVHLRIKGLRKFPRFPPGGALSRNRCKIGTPSLCDVTSSNRQGAAPERLLLFTTALQTGRSILKLTDPTRARAGAAFCYSRALYIWEDPS